MKANHKNLGVLLSRQNIRNSELKEIIGGGNNSCNGGKHGSTCLARDGNGYFCKTAIDSCAMDDGTSIYCCTYDNDYMASCPSSQCVKDNGLPGAICAASNGDGTYRRC
ncbi:MAG: hypothetical protein QM535_21425 [Limnohabitans sp.]|nr:hypothetical protein [Limnohabitans sp.]